MVGTISTKICTLVIYINNNDNNTHIPYSLFNELITITIIRTLYQTIYYGKKGWFTKEQNISLSINNLNFFFFFIGKSHLPNRDAYWYVRKICYPWNIMKNEAITI